MKALLAIMIALPMGTILSAAIPTERAMTVFLDDMNVPFAIIANGCNFNSSLYLGGTPHFNINAGVTSTGASITDPVGEGDMKPTLSMFHIRGTIGLLTGLRPASSWEGLFGLEVGAKAFATPLFGDIGRDKESYPYGFGGSAKISLLKGEDFIPDLSFSLEYTYLLNGTFEYHDYQAQESATCNFTLGSFYYHFDAMTRFNLVGIHAGLGWISPRLEADYSIAGVEGTHESEAFSLLKYYGGFSVPVDLVDVSFEIGQADQNTFFGIGLGFRM